MLGGICVGYGNFETSRRLPAYYAKSLELMFTMEKIIDKNKALLNATTLLALHPDLETRKSARDAIEMMRHKDKASSRDVMESILEWVKIAEEEHAAFQF